MRVRDSVRSCYSTWGDRYYAEYYGPNAPYPPVHRDLIIRLLRGRRRVLDAGCGPASMMRDLHAAGFDVRGFDVTPGMVDEGRRVMRSLGLDEDRVWIGDVTAVRAYRGAPYDAAICVGVVPHVPEEDDVRVIRRLRAAVRTGGRVVLQARNELFALFTLNRYSHEFFMDGLIGADDLRRRAGRERRGLEKALAMVRDRFRTDLPPVRRGRKGEPGYDEVLSRGHNPFILREQFAAAGFRDVRVLYYHFHALPPMVQSLAPTLFRRASLARERSDDWRGAFMASAFFVTGLRS